MQMSGNVARLLLHPVGVLVPRLEQRIHIDRIDFEQVDKDEERQVAAELKAAGRAVT